MFCIKTPRSLCFLSTQVLTLIGIHNTLEMKRLQETHIIILKISVFENREHKNPVKRADEAKNRKISDELERDRH